MSYQFDSAAVAGGLVDKAIFNKEDVEALLDSRKDEVAINPTRFAPITDLAKLGTIRKMKIPESGVW